MSNKPPTDATLQSTKQMLDELDALMEKMLAAPASDLEEPAPLPTPKPALSATLTMLEPEVGQFAEAPPAPRVSTPATASLPFNPPHFETPAPTESVGYETPTPEPLSNEVAPPDEVLDLEPLLREIPEVPAASVSTRWGYLPLLWINQGFDGMTLVLGPLGGWMRTEGGRMLLGLSGFILLAAAVVWFVKDLLGWNW